MRANPPKQETGKTEKTKSKTTSKSPRRCLLIVDVCPFSPPLLFRLWVGFFCSFSFSPRMVEHHLVAFAKSINLSKRLLLASNQPAPLNNYIHCYQIQPPGTITFIGINQAALLKHYIHCYQINQPPWTITFIAAKSTSPEQLHSLVSNQPPVSHLGAKMDLNSRASEGAFPVATSTSFCWHQNIALLSTWCKQLTKMNPVPKMAPWRSHFWPHVQLSKKNQKSMSTVPFLGPSGGTKNETAKSQNQQQRSPEITQCKHLPRCAMARRHPPWTSWIILRWCVRDVQTTSRKYVSKLLVRIRMVSLCRRCSGVLSHAIAGPVTITLPWASAGWSSKCCNWSGLWRHGQDCLNSVSFDARAAYTVWSWGFWLGGELEP